MKARIFATGIAALLMAVLLSLSAAALISLPPIGSTETSIIDYSPILPGCYQTPAAVCGNGIQEAGEQCDITWGTDAGFKVCPDGTTAAIQCIGCNFIENPCGGCIYEYDCIDGDPCTIDTCVSGKCQQEPAPPDHVKAYSPTPPYEAVETCGSVPIKNPSPCGNDKIDPLETCASCSADVKCGSSELCTASGACKPLGCTPGQTKNYKCAGQCETASQEVCNSVGDWVPQSVTDKTCAPVCSVTVSVPCGNGKIDSGETCSSCSADVKCGSGEFCSAGTSTCQPVPPSPPTCSPYTCALQGGVCVGSSCIIQPPPAKVCSPGSSQNKQCVGCNQAKQDVCNAEGTGYTAQYLADNSCGSACVTGCTPAVPCSALGCGKTDSCGNSCGACPVPVPVPVADPCANPDVSKTCCEGKGFVWAKSGEGKTFGGFTSLGQNGCVGDDGNEYLRFRECEGNTCTTDSKDAAACSSPYSCVFEGKCYSRLDKAADESADVQQKISESKGKEDKLSKLLQKLEELHNKAKAAATVKERREISKEIANVMRDIRKLTNEIGEQSSGTVTAPGQGGTTATLLCTPPGALAQG